TPADALFANSSPWFHSLIVDGIIGGLGGALPFFPLIFVLFLGMSFFEDSGYMARTAFLMDNIMKKVGLSGKAF
ncbi:ferrous iron transporter B, partial [bacterium 210820-DFI.6.52]|nr:ferrous iron transporter B [bacterium 210820-DFI.6.52]